MKQAPKFAFGRFKSYRNLDSNTANTNKFVEINRVIEINTTMIQYNTFVQILHLGDSEIMDFCFA